jgi:tRNA nucleotidyltransferase (CCA-adding enzyme)
VSKERIGIEVTKMMQHDPLSAIDLIDRLGLHSSIFSCSLHPPRHESLAAAQILSEIGKRYPLNETLWLAAALCPFRGLIVKAKKEVPAVSVVVSDGLKVKADRKRS